MVPLVSTTDLRVRSVRRQHVVDCEPQLNNKRKRDLLADTPPRPTMPTASSTHQGRPPPNSPVAAQQQLPDRQDANGEIDVDFLSSDSDDDVREVRRQNDLSVQPPHTVRRIDGADDDGIARYDSRNAVSFRPTVVERKVHDAIIQPAYGKDAQALLEFWQRSDHSRFLAAPPTCRGLYDIGFGERDLSILHLTTVTTAARVRAKDSGVNLADFSRRNILRAAPAPTSLHQIVNALQNLRVFALEFYKPPVVEFIDKAQHFLSRYGDDAHSDSTMCKVFVFWIDSKLGKYRTRILAGGLAAAAQVGNEFSRHDEELAELKEYFAGRNASSKASHYSAHSHRDQRRDDKPTIPATVTSDLPRQNGKELCLRYLSKAGCRENYEGRCTRGHFRPNTLPTAARKVIGGEETTRKSNRVDCVARDAEVDAAIYYARRCATLDAVRLSNRATIAEQHRSLAASHGLEYVDATNGEEATINSDHAKLWSELAKRLRISLPEFARMYCGQTSADPRPNKDLSEMPIPPTGPMRSIIDQWNAIVRTGVKPKWYGGHANRRCQRHQNHGSIADEAASIRRHIRKGQRDGRYLVFEENVQEMWPEIHVSPLGIVEKQNPDGVDTRMINDYSFPEGDSVNDMTIRDEFPVITYNPPADIARRIHELRTLHLRKKVVMMVGDVAGAFRHIPIDADEVYMFAFIFEGFVIIDLACGFGWCGSPAYYSLAGRAINFLYETAHQVNYFSLAESLHGNVWCDDHSCIEIDEGGRCFKANLALRDAMATVLGPTALNEKKFTSWDVQCRALGLAWNTSRGFVSIPSDKLSKVISRVHGIVSRAETSRSSLSKLLGSLRYVATCFPPARAFNQRLQTFEARCSRFTTQKVPTDVTEDIYWFRSILQNPERFNGIPVSLFAKDVVAIHHVFMDASDDGICALEPALRQYIRVQFTEHEKLLIKEKSTEHSINVRELRSAVLATLHWGPSWRRPEEKEPVPVCLHIDNTSAVSWGYKRASRNTTAQLYNRLLSLTEFQFNISLSKQHIAGVDNVMADAGSRAWSPDHHLYSLWTNLCSSWTQVHVLPPYDGLCGLWDTCCAETPWQALPRSSTTVTGSNGPASPGRWAGRPG